MPVYQFQHSRINSLLEKDCLIIIAASSLFVNLIFSGCPAAPHFLFCKKVEEGIDIRISTWYYNFRAEQGAAVCASGGIGRLARFRF